MISVSGVALGDWQTLFYLHVRGMNRASASIAQNVHSLVLERLRKNQDIADAQAE